jgi:cyclopropane-fatty-acyl-phospholipid synthase
VETIATGAGSEILSARTRRRVHELGVPFVIRAADGRVERFGAEEPLFDVTAANDAGLAALRSLSELRIAEAYLDGDIDVAGDLVAEMDVRPALSDVRLLLRGWTLLEPLLLGRRRLNPRWVAKHYDAGDMQLLAIDERYNLYTPGLYENEDDPLEAGAERRLEHVFAALGLERGAALLDVGCGWGGFLRYCAARDVDATGISLSRHQLAHPRACLQADRLGA